MAAHSHPRGCPWAWLTSRLIPRCWAAPWVLAVFSFMLQIQCDPAWHSVPSAPLSLEASGHPTAPERREDPDYSS